MNASRLRRSLLRVAVPVLGAALVLAATPLAAQAATSFTVSPSSWNAGTVLVGRTRSVTITFTNTGTTTIRIGNVSISEDRDFSGGGGSCQGAVLRPGQACTTRVTFGPTVPIENGVRTATLFFMNASTPTVLARIPLRGTAKSPARIDPAASWDFGNIPLGFFAWMDFTATNVSGQQLNFGDVFSSGDLDFEVDPGSCAFAQLAANASCSFTVFFEPSGTGPHFTAIDFENATDTMILVELPVTGTGTN